MTAMPRDFSVFVRATPDGLAAMDLAVEGMHCAACMKAIERGLSAEPGVVAARSNLSSRRVHVEWRPAETDAASVLDRMAAIGFRAHPFRLGGMEDAEAREEKRLLLSLAVAGFAAMNIMLLSVSVWAGHASSDLTPETRDFFHWLSGMIALPAALYAGRPFFESAFKALRARRVNMDVPISLGVLLALGLSVAETLRSAEHAYFDSAVMLLFFLLVGRVLERIMRRKTRAVAANLAALRAETACKLVSDTETRIVPVAALVAGDRIRVLPGERIPADGVVAEGHSAVDASLVTGETRPAEIGPGSAVHAGTLNLTGLLTLAVEKAGEGTLLAEVEDLFHRATEIRNRYVQLADRAAQLYAPVVHLAAALTFLGWLAAGAGWHQALLVAVTVLIITCPCALALAIPAVQVVAVGALFRRGVLLHSGDALERLAAVDRVVFDKTGTLTEPDPVLVGAEAVPPVLLDAAARLAPASRHPLARVLARALPAAPVAGARETSGTGVEAEIDGLPAFLGRPDAAGLAAEADAFRVRHPGASILAVRLGEAGAVIGIGQSLRADARAAAEALRAQGLALEILSGDHADAVAETGQALGISERRAGVKPAEKIARLDALRNGGHRTLMVGDGLNDAPALAAAHVSLSPVEAAHLAQAAADGLFLGGRLMAVADSVAIARRAHRIMKQNLALAVIYNAFAVPLAVAGFVTPLIAALAMSGSSILVTLNALRAGGRIGAGETR